MRNFKTLSLIIPSAILLAACTTPLPPAEPVKVVERVPEPVPPKAPVVETRDVAPPTKIEPVDPLNDPKGVLVKRSVYFDFDSYVVRDDGKPIVENHASYLNKNKARKILIQGNTDERGGTEYNLALGQKRAEAVRRAMNAVGVPEAQMEAVSLGKEKPKAQGHDEAAWAENRRADIVY